MTSIYPLHDLFSVGISLWTAISKRCTVEFHGLPDVRRKRRFKIRLTSNGVDSSARRGPLCNKKPRMGLGGEGLCSKL
jgi:hypothetical protein